MGIIPQGIQSVLKTGNTIDRHKAVKMVKTAFPNIAYSENRFISVKGDKSPFDGDINYWSKRKQRIVRRQEQQEHLENKNHSCGHCGLKFLDEEKVELHHIDGNHNNWDDKNLLAIHRSCHHYIHMSKSRKD